MFCPNCGAKIPDDSVFCEKCGYRIDGGENETFVPDSGAEQQVWEEAPEQFGEEAPEQTWEEAPVQTLEEAPEQTWEDAPAQAWEQAPAKPSYTKFIAIGAAALVVIIALALLLGRGKKDDSKAKEGPQASAQTPAETEVENTSEREAPAKAEEPAGSEDAQQTENSSTAEETSASTGSPEDLSTDGSEGLSYTTAVNDRTGGIGYVVTGTKNCTDTDIVVPQARRSYDGELQPYLWDDASGFRGMEEVRSVTLPEGALEVRSGFGYSPKLEWVALPSTIRYIGQGILENCPAFREIRYNGTMEQWQAIEKSGDWLMGWYNVEQFDIVCKDGVLHGDEAPEVGAGTGNAEAGTTEAGTTEASTASEANEAGAGSGGPKAAEQPKSPEELSRAEMDELAAQLSTEQYPVTGEFLWAKDFILSGARTVPEVLKSDKVIRITGDRMPLIDGGWKVYISTADGEYGSDMDQYLNAQITPQGDSIRIHMVRDRWFYLGTDEIIRDGTVFDFEGSLDAGKGSAQAYSDDARLDLDEFYITKDGMTEYALGTFTWISGEKDRVMMMREIPVLESFEWNIGGSVPSGGTKLGKPGEIGGDWKSVLATMTDVDGVSQTRVMLGITHIRFDGNSASVEIDVRKRFQYPTEDKDSMEALETGEGIVLTFSGDWNESTGEISVRSHNSTLALKISEFTELDGIRYAAGGVYNDTVRIGDFAMYSE